MIPCQPAQANRFSNGLLPTCQPDYVAILLVLVVLSTIAVFATIAVYELFGRGKKIW